MDNTSPPVIELQKPQHIVSLQSAAILVTVPVRVWTATKQDKAASDELTTAKKADRSAASVTQHLLANNPTHKKLLNYRQLVYNWLERETYPWAGGLSVLPVVNLPKFMAGYEKHAAEFNKLVDEFLQIYPTLISDMAFQMGDMFNRNNYPTVDQVRMKFSIDVYTSEIPSGDFRNAIAQELADDLHKTYSRQANELVQSILTKQVEQLVSVMESISHCTDTEIVTEDDGSQTVRRRKIYQTTIERALELCDTFEKFNLTKSPELEEAAFRLRKTLAGLDVKQIRNSETLRVTIKSEVDDILGKFGSFSK